MKQNVPHGEELADSWHVARWYDKNSAESTIEPQAKMPPHLITRNEQRQGKPSTKSDDDNSHLIQKKWVYVPKQWHEKHEVQKGSPIEWFCN